MNKTLLTVLSGMLLGIVFTLFKGTVIMLGVIIIVGVALWNYLPEPDRGFLIRLFIIGISLRIVLLATIYIISISRGGYGEIIPDSRLYFIRTVSMIQSWKGQPHFPGQFGERAGFPGHLYILSFFYLLVGLNTLIPNPTSLFSDKLISCLIGILTGILIFYITKDIFGKKAAKISSLFVIFYPSLVLWSITNTREPSNILLVCLIIFSLLRFWKVKKACYLVLLFVSLLVLKTIRLYIFSFTLIAVVLSLLIILWKNVKIKFFALFLVMLSIIFLNFTSQERIVRNKLFNFSAIVKTASSSNKNVIAQGGSVYRIYDEDLLSARGINKFKFAKGAIKGFVYFMLVPFPWMISSKEQLMAYPQIIIWYLIIPFVFMGIFFAIRYRFKMSLILISYLFLVTSGFALIEGNVGSAMRHRDLVLPFYFIFGAVGIAHIFSHRVLDENKK